MEHVVPLECPYSSAYHRSGRKAIPTLVRGVSIFEHQTIGYHSWHIYRHNTCQT